MARGTLPRFASTFFKTASSFYLAYKYGFFVAQVDGPSMFPTFIGKRELVLSECLPYVADRVKAGDVVICTRPVNARENIIKRVAAVAGEKVTVYEPRGSLPSAVTVPPGHIWLEGDNLILSRDSREYGPVPLAMVRGRVLLQVWPKLQLVTSTPPGRRS